MKKVYLAFLTAFLGLFGIQAKAVAPDVSALVTEIGTYSQPMSDIGIAVLALIVLAAGFMWLRRVIR